MRRWLANPVKWLLMACIHGYRLAVSPVLGPSCRYLPSCSAYAEEAIQLHGAVHGGRLAVSRVLRCHPFHAGGYDPVPLGKPGANGQLKAGDLSNGLAAAETLGEGLRHGA